jgi:hypothetical protein
MDTRFGGYNVFKSCAQLHRVSKAKFRDDDMKTKLVSLLGALAVLAFAYGLDSWVDMMRNSLSQSFPPSFQFSFFYANAGLANLLLAGTLWLLAWYVIFKAEKSGLITSLYIFSGLLATFSLVIYIAIPSPYSQWPINPMPILAPTSHFSIAGGMILLLGIWKLVSKSVPARLAS